MIDKESFALFSRSPAAFRDRLVVDVDGTPKVLGGVLDDWQRTDFAALDAALLRCNGQSSEPAIMRAWLERARGHSKTTDLAVLCCWAMAFSTRPLKGYCYAADKDQAGLLRDAMRTVIRLNPWLGKILEVKAQQVEVIAQGHPGQGGTLTIEASDVGSSFGILPDLIIADEVCHWQGDGSLWHSLLSSAAKRSNCLLVAITNSGFVDSWQWKVREAARTDANWYFSHLDGPVASWMTPERLAEQERMLPATAYARLWLNEWSTGGGDALTEADILAAFKPELAPLPERSEGWQFVAGLDLGVSRDASAICVLGVRKRNPWEADHTGHGRIRLAYTKVWRPTAKRKINLQDVENALFALHHGYRFRAVNYDPWQAEHLSQRLSLLNLPMVPITPTGANHQRIATTVIEAFNDRRVDLYEDENLKRDLRRLRVEERAYGFRLVAPRDESGHGDLGTAFSLAMLAASDKAGKRSIKIGTFSLTSRDRGERDAFARAHRELDRLNRERQKAYASAQQDDIDAEINAMYYGPPTSFSGD